MITRQKVISSTIAEVGYDMSSLVLEVQFTNGQVYRYDNVPPLIHQALMEAQSVGSYFAQTIKAQPNLYPFTRVEIKTPTVRSLRLAWVQAIKDTCDDLRAIDASAARVRRATDEGIKAADEVIKAVDTEILAGRAFLAALDREEPACRICGCTFEEPCGGGEEDYCSWVHKPGERPLCSACVGL